MGADTSSSDNKSSQTSEVWGGQSPFLQQLYQEGQNLYQQFQPNTEIPGQAQQAWQQQLNPQANPYLNSMTQGYRDQLGMANQNTGGQAGLSGGYGGGRQGVLEAQNMNNYSTQVGNFMGQQTQMGLDQQGRAIGQAGQMMGLDPQQQQMQMLQQQGQLIGGPTVLGEGSSSGGSSSFGFGLGGGK